MERSKGAAGILQKSLVDAFIKGPAGPLSCLGFVTESVKGDWSCEVTD